MYMNIMSFPYFLPFVPTITSERVMCCFSGIVSTHPLGSLAGAARLGQPKQYCSGCGQPMGSRAITSILMATAARNSWPSSARADIESSYIRLSACCVDAYKEVFAIECRPHYLLHYNITISVSVPCGVSLSFKWCSLMRLPNFFYVCIFLIIFMFYGCLDIY